MCSEYTSSGYNALYTYISSPKKSKKLIDFSSRDSHMVTTHCSNDQAIRCLFTAERTGCETFIIIWLNKLICPSEYPLPLVIQFPVPRFRQRTPLSAPPQVSIPHVKAVFAGSGKSLDNTAFAAGAAITGAAMVLVIAALVVLVVAIMW